MREAHTILELTRERGKKGLPLERVYRFLYNPDLYLMAYGRIYRNDGAMTKGVTEETVDGMSIDKIKAIIEDIRQERYRWHPAKRTYIPKKNGKKRPLGIQVWSDKLLQEVLRLIFDAYFDVRFSTHSHGFRPERGCHTALREIYYTWGGSVWFIEGDISQYFDKMDHEILVSMLREHIKDERFIRLISHLLEAGYLEDWNWKTTYSGTPQGSIVSPVLSNVYLDKLDQYVETELIPKYTKGEKRQRNKRWAALRSQVSRQRKKGNRKRADEFDRQARQLPAGDPNDPNFRRLKYIRYADDFCLGFIGTKAEAEEIKRFIKEFLRDVLKLDLSEEKTLITHARTETARFLNYEIQTLQEDSHRNTHLDHDKRRRSINGHIGLRIPKDVLQKHCQRFKKHSRTIKHRAALVDDTDFSIIDTYQAEYRGLVEYYRLAYNLWSLNLLKKVTEISLTKTLACKFRTNVGRIYRKYEAKHEVDGRSYKVLQVVKEREGKRPLIARWGAIPLIWDISAPIDDKRKTRWIGRTELEKRLLADTCEYCGATGSTAHIQVHHIRALKDLEKYTGRDRPRWAQIMAARKRKTLVLCATCHQDVTYGRPMRRKPKSLHGGTMLESAVL